MSRSETPTVDADEDDLAYAVGRYALEQISIGKAAELAGVDRWTMLSVLQNAGITPRLGPETVEDARREVAVALEQDPDEYVAHFEEDTAADGEE
jgi:predicted HTH domain antitoxin